MRDQPIMQWTVVFGCWMTLCSGARASPDDPEPRGSSAVTLHIGGQAVCAAGATTSGRTYGTCVALPALSAGVGLGRARWGELSVAAAWQGFRALDDAVRGEPADVPTVLLAEATGLVSVGLSVEVLQPSGTSSPLLQRVRVAAALGNLETREGRVVPVAGVIVGLELDAFVVRFARHHPNTEE